MELTELSLLLVFKCLGARDLCAVSCVSKQWREIALQVAHQRMGYLLAAGNRTYSRWELSTGYDCVEFRRYRTSIAGSTILPA